MNTGYKIRNVIKRIENGVVVQQYDYTTNPSLTAAQLSADTGMPLSRATQLINERLVLDTIDCPLPLLGQIQFVRTTYSIQEPNIGVSYLTIELERLLGCDENIIATVDVVGGTALPLNDYTNIFPITVTWLDGDCSNKTIDIPIVGDTLDEVDETIILEITNLTAGSLGNNTQTTITIVDNDTIYNVNVINSNTSTCNVTGTPIYPYTQQVNQGQSITLPINTTCTVTALLVNNINQSQTTIDNVNLTGQFTITPTVNTTVEIVYGNVNCQNGLIWTPYIGNTLNPFPQLNLNNTRVVFKFQDINNVEQTFDQTINANDWQTMLITLNTLLNNDSRLINAGYYTSFITLPLNSFRVTLQSGNVGKTLNADDIRNNNIGIHQYTCGQGQYVTFLTAKEVLPDPAGLYNVINLYY